MTRSLPLMLLALSACTKPLTDLPNEPNGNPVVPETAMLPYPSDLWLTEDASMPSGRRVDFGAALLEQAEGDWFADADGFSRAAPLLTWFPDGVDGSTLPTVAESIEADSPVSLVDLTTGERVPVLAELDMHTDNDREQVLIIRPARAMAADTPHAVVIRDGVRLVDGSAPRLTRAMEALRDDIPTDSDEVEALRESFEPVRDWLDAEGVDPETVVQAWTFTTRSEEQLWQAPLALHDAQWTFELAAPTVDEDFIDEAKQIRIIRGTYEAPYFLDADDRLVRDESGEPVQQGMQTVEYQVTIPLTIDGTSKVPVICYGHGFFSNKEEASRSLVEGLHHWGMIAVSIDFDGFNSHEESEGLARLGKNLEELDIIVSQQLQAQSKFTGLHRLVTEHLADMVELDLGQGTYKPMDADQVVYAGISNGGTQGLSILAASPAFDRGAVVVPGGGWSHMLQRAVQWNTMGLLWSSSYDDADELQISLALAQQRFDPADSLNFSDRLVTDRMDGRSIAVSMHEAVNDAQVANIVTHMVARTSGAKLLTPSPLDIDLVDEVDGNDPDIDLGLFVYAEDVEAVPASNLPPSDDNRTHSTVRQLESYLDHMGTFLGEGRFELVCDGPCDPN
ncbi:MAG: hypothetical protein EP330_04920 [Deltaproteobacteria bacterium]|nr:MAG: hypothetical protein EP330_04920 [Deltaproteobacteria bacterium]